jgi:hypothetical protein
MYDRRMDVQSDKRRRRHEALKTMTIECFCRGRVSLSINNQFLYFVRVDGRAKLPNYKVLMKSLVI